jgi:hypothetical protein
MICLECKKEIKSIGYKHLKSCCGLTTIEYKLKYPNAQLVDDDIKKKCAHYGKDNHAYKPEKHNKTVWERKCQCGKIVKHQSYQSYLRALNEKRLCQVCIPRKSWLGKKHQEKTKQKISNSNKGKEYNKSKLGIKESDITKQKKSLALKGRVGTFLNKKHFLETKLKMRLKRIEDLNKKFPLGWTSPNYNKKACKLFEEINKTLNWIGQHAENGKEKIVLGYFLDYYEPNLNIAIEYDEKTHEKPKQKRRDEEKQKLITEHLKCKFYRIKEGEEYLWKEILRNEIP